MSEEQKKNKTSISRREFLKDAGLVVGGVAVASTLAAKGVGATTAETKNVTVEKPKANVMPDSAKAIAPVAPPAKWDFEADVVVVGAGASGLMAACKAKDSGANVIVLEKNSIIGGDGQWAETTFGKNQTLESWLVVDEGQFSPKDGKNARLMYKIFENSNDILDYMTKSMGIVLAQNPNALGGAAAIGSYVQEYGFPPPAAGGGLPSVPVAPDHPDDIDRWHPHEARGFTQGMYRYAKKIGVSFLISNPASALVTQANRVVGVKATDNTSSGKGKDVYVKGKSVILCTGGLVANRPMFEYYVPSEKLKFICKYAGMPSATGDGIRMGTGVGAFLEEMQEFDLWDGGVDDPAYANGPRSVYTAANQLARQKSLSVNLLAKRFTNEARYSGSWYTYNGYQKCYQLDSTSITLFDANCIKKEDIIAKFDPLACEYPVPWFNQDFERQLKAGIIKKADTIEGIAKLMGLDPATLKATVDRYNALCAKGKDTDFGKQAKYMVPIRVTPFYAVKEQGGIYWHHGGGMVYNENLQVVDKNWQPIPGLFLAGQNGRTLCHLANALPSGYLAGKYAAQAASGQTLEF